MVNVRKSKSGDGITSLYKALIRKGGVYDDSAPVLGAAKLVNSQSVYRQVMRAEKSRR